VKPNSTTHFNILVQLSKLYNEISNNELCLKTISTLLKIELDVEMILLASSIHMKNLENAKALEFLNMVENNQEVTIRKGIAYFQLEDYEKSSNEFRIASLSDPSNKKLKKYLSMAIWRSGKKFQAIKEYFSSF
jgi:tetratricopeptide (TPR) repeat protein